MTKLLNRRDVEVTPSRTSSQPQQSLLLGLPTELILKIFGDLYKPELFSLSQSCRRLNTIASSAFLRRHNIIDPTKSIYLRSNKFEILSFLRIYILFTSCDFFQFSFRRNHYLNETRGLDRLVQRLSSMKKVVLDMRDQLVISLQMDETHFVQAFQSLLSNIIDRSCEHLAISCYLRLHNENRGQYQKARNRGPSFISRVFHALLAGPSRNTLPVHDHSGGLTFDPRRKSKLKTFEINSPTLLKAPFLRWTSQVISVSPIAHLSLENPGSWPFDWNNILSAIDSPSLSEFHIKDPRREIPLTALFAFLSRHPNVSLLLCEGLSLQQGQESLSFSHPKVAKLDLSHEDAACLLTAADFPSLCRIFLSSPSLPRNFNSSAMNHALKVIGRIVHKIDLCLAIPGGSMAPMTWLDVDVDIDKETASSARAELTLHCATSLSLYPATMSGPFGVKMLSLLPKWLGLFPSLQCLMFFYCFSMGTPKAYKLDFIRSLAKACPKLEKVMFDSETRTISDWLA